MLLFIFSLYQNKMLRKCIFKSLENFRTIHSSSLSSLIKFNQEEREKILAAINCKTPEELSSYDISKGRTQKIFSRRAKYGDFKNLEEILQIDGFGIKILEKMAKKIINFQNVDVGDLAKPPKPKSLKLWTPLINDAIRKNCKAIIALHIGVTSVSWARIKLDESGSSEMTHWQHMDILHKKLHLSDLTQRCLYLDHEIPKADCYIIENPQTAQPTLNSNAEQMNINLQKTQLLAIISFALARRNQMDTDNASDIPYNVFYFKRFVAAKLFNTFVGTEKVSTEENILNLFQRNNNQVGIGAETNSNFNIPEKFQEIYNNTERYQREFMGQALLLCLAFLRLAIMNCPQSLAKISNKTSL